MYYKRKKVWFIVLVFFIAFLQISFSTNNVFSNQRSNTKVANKKYNRDIPPNLSKNISIFSTNIVNNNKIKKYVYLGGNPIGIKLKTKGVLVVALSDITSENGLNPSPAIKADIRIGDYLLSINDKKLINSKDITDIVKETGAKVLKVAVERQGNTSYKYIKPVKSKEDSKYKLGLWVRDSTAGVGTLTFYDKNTKKFGALGHPITDIDTGVMFKVDTGKIIQSSIVSVRKGQKQNPGELRGIFVDEDVSLGKIKSNTQCGIFGYCKKNIINSKFTKPVEVAEIGEIKQGPAQIITTIDGEEPKAYDIVIEKLLNQKVPTPKSMVIRITDSELLKKTGGIVQGMSGSPIIQNGKLIGAVTHVLVNKPNVGYGIYIEWMIKDLNNIM